jgi:hypothetical protein
VKTREKKLLVILRSAEVLALSPLTVCCEWSEGLWPLAYVLLAIDREAGDQQHINDVECMAKARKGRAPSTLRNSLTIIITFDGRI